MQGSLYNIIYSYGEIIQIALVVTDHLTFQNSRQMHLQVDDTTLMNSTPLKFV